MSASDPLPPKPKSTLLGKLFKRPRYVFLADAFGAAITCSLLWFVLIDYSWHFGLEESFFRSLALLVVPFILYSFIVFLVNPTNWQPFLKGIAVANCLYSMLTILLLFLYWGKITTMGMAYFLGEASLILIIGWLEWDHAQRNEVKLF